jgi:Xaa-Pro aminopeptidase
MSHAESHLIGERIARVRAFMEQVPVDGLLVTHQPNIRYLTNFAGSSGAVLLTGDRLWLITDSRYVTVVEALFASPSGPPGALLAQVKHSYDEEIVRLAGKLGIARLGFEADHLTFGRHGWIADRIKPLATSSKRSRSLQLIPTQKLIERLRLVKDAHEIETFRRGGRLVSTVGRSIVDEVAAGRTEREIGMRIDWAMREAGFERPAFETIVASGPNSAMPHARPSDRRLRVSDLVVLDFGGVYDGYCVDLTRTLSVGAIDRESARIHAAVLEAQTAAIAAVRPGVPATDVDDAAREVLTSHGLGEAFGHGTGHGLGLEVHEEPRISRRRTDVPVEETLLQSGMVFTIEPGAYLAGWGGVRIEDDVLVTADGCDVLTSVPKVLRP